MADPEAPSSDFDFELARRAVERGWVTREQVESALLELERAPGPGLLSRLPLSPSQIQQLQSRPRLPDDVAALLSDPRKQVGKYVVTQQLGSGGMGTVVKAYDTQLNRWVALKFLKSIGDDTARRYFEREARLAAALSHPHIAAIYEVGHHQDLPFIAMQFVDGKNLHEARKHLTLRQALEAVRAVAEALKHAHERNVVHRDLKPANVMIDARGRVFVMDFGLAKETGADGQSLGGSSVVAGTPQYMAPEQTQGRADAQSDVYGLGAILYELATGRPPFVGETAADIFLQIANDEPVWPRKLNPSVPRDVEAIILRCLEKDRRRRYPGVDPLLDDLSACIEGNPLRHARPPSALYVLGKKIRKRPVLWSASTAALLALATAIGAAIVQGREAAETIEQLSDRTRIEELRQRAETALWPAVPENVPRMEQWIHEAEILARRLPIHRERLERLCRRATGTNPSAGHGCTFDRPTLQWHHNALRDLVEELARFEEEPRATVGGFARILDGESASIGAMRRRLDFARTVRKRSVEDPAAAWSAARAAIAAHPRYGFAIPPQVGLVPLGPDPASGLWEFADLQTGDAPTRGPDGRLVRTAQTGVVFVLVPAGTFSMGADASVDPDAQEDFEAPRHEVSLRPFFLSKYELTQAQWMRFAGANPSQYRAGRTMAVGTGYSYTFSPLHPLESVSWTDLSRALAKLGFTLPTEAQWEYAARAGTVTPFWTGGERRSLADAANVADLVFKRYAGEPGLPHEPWDDGFAWHAPVGSLRANAFGLHDMTGNVWEWCRDGYAPYREPLKPGSPDGERDAPDSGSRVLRGGGWRGNALECRSAFRAQNSAGTRLVGLGARAARPITPSAD